MLLLCGLKVDKDTFLVDQVEGTGWVVYRLLVWLIDPGSGRGSLPPEWWVAHKKMAWRLLSSVSFTQTSGFLPCLLLNGDPGNADFLKGCFYYRDILKVLFVLSFKDKAKSWNIWRSPFIKQWMVFMGILNLLRWGWSPFDFAICYKMET